MKERAIYLGGGCFWGLQGYIRQIPGIVSTEVAMPTALLPTQVMKMYVMTVAM